MRLLLIHTKLIKLIIKTSDLPEYRKHISHLLLYDSIGCVFYRYVHVNDWIEFAQEHVYTNGNINPLIAGWYRLVLRGNLYEDHTGTD